MAGPWISQFGNTTVTASPALAAETIVATLPNVTTDGPTRRVFLEAWIAFTVGTSGTAVRGRIRQSSLTGTLIADTGAITGGIAAAGLVTLSCFGIDTPGDVSAFTYVYTLQVTAGAAASTVSAAYIAARIGS